MRVAELVARGDDPLQRAHLRRVALLLRRGSTSTGGASGQGCNSALQDAAALADALIETRGDDVAGTLEKVNERVPEGHALLDLSVGPKGALRRARFGLSAVAAWLLSVVRSQVRSQGRARRFGLSAVASSDSKFGIDRRSLVDSTSLEPFAEIRRRATGPLASFLPPRTLREMQKKRRRRRLRDGRKTVRYLETVGPARARGVLRGAVLAAAELHVRGPGLDGQSGGWRHDDASLL